MFLHELGHVLNVRLTGDLTLAPPAFLEFGESFFPGLSDRHRSVSGELFAHCFAMGVFSRHPELRELDPFTMVTVEDKQAFGQFMEAGIPVHGQASSGVSLHILYYFNGKEL